MHILHKKYVIIAQFNTNPRRMNHLEIKRIRKKLALSQTAFGKMLGVGLRSVQNWESGDRTISDSVKKLLESIIKEKATLHKVTNNDSSTPAIEKPLEDIIIERVLQKLGGVNTSTPYSSDIIKRLEILEEKDLERKQLRKLILKNLEDLTDLNPVVMELNERLDELEDIEEKRSRLKRT